MAKEICISSTPHETRLAILEDDQLSEIYYERENEYTLAGSIYNGRVTRVLPGMQSAFVDIGLERDAFLYVTDFIEIEDPEAGDEVERTADAAAPRPVRPGSARQEGREARQEPRNEGRTRRTTAEAEQARPTEAVQEEREAQGGEEGDSRRLRGRRRRRGGRRPEPQAGATGTSETEEFEVEEQEATAPATLSEERPVEREAYAPRRDERRRERHDGRREERREERREGEATSSRVLLPGESLQKYGAKAEDPAKGESRPEPARQVSSFKPATLIESPIVWDGVGPLPGETISRYRKPEAAAAAEAKQPPVAETAAAPATGMATPLAGVSDMSEEEFTSIEGITHGADLSEEEFDEDLPEEEDDAEDEELEIDDEEFEEHPHPLSFAERIEHAHSVVESLLDEAEEEGPADASVHIEAASAATESAEAGAAHAAEKNPEGHTASHNVDPLPPSEFRLFGIEFGKKKQEQPKSTYSPGKGRVEEEVIEGDEYVSRSRKNFRRKDGRENLQEETRTAQRTERPHEARPDRRPQRDGGEQEDSGGPRRDRDRNRFRDRDRRGSSRRGPARRTAQATDLPIISDLLKPGQEILVQIAKEPIAKKGARITSHIALPGRFLVFMPTVSHIGVSRKIASDEERHRLKRILLSERGEQTGGFIVRTAAEGTSEDELRADLRFLLHLWGEIKNRSEGSKSPALIYHDLSLIERILRDQISDDFSSIWVDSEADYERIVRFLNRFSPSLVRRVKLYSKEVPLFEHFGVEDEISKALRSKVWLKSGGSIVINQTEALVAIDINTGKYVGKTARLEDTILKTNLDAIPEIVRQMRLRDLGGIIVIDFIDMDERKNRSKVMAALEEALKADRAPTKVLQFNDFGLVAITRKRVKQSLERTLSVACPTCQATGMVKSPMTVANEIFIELRKMRKHFESRDVTLRVHPETVKVLKSNNSRWLADYEELVGRNILLKSDAALNPEQYDIQG